MKLAIVAADYTAGEADQLRRSMAAWKRHGGMEPHRERITAGLLELGYTDEFAAQLFEQIKGFGSYGFPESHAASFANLVYVSCWLKCHEPAAFACALLNSQPMGFYAPSQIVQELRASAACACTRSTCATATGTARWKTPAQPTRPTGAAPGPAHDRRLQRNSPPSPSTAARAAAVPRRRRPLPARRLHRRHREALAEAGALRGLAGHRHRARWAVTGVQAQLPLFAARQPPSKPASPCRRPARGQDTAADYASTGLSLGPHPLRQLRAQLRGAAAALARTARPPHGSPCAPPAWSHPPATADRQRRHLRHHGRRTRPDQRDRLAPHRHPAPGAGGSR